MRLPLPKVFYGWWIVIAGGVVGAMNSGFYYYGFGAFFTPIINEFGWTRAELSGAFSIARFEGGIISPIAGYMIDRFGPRIMIAVGVIIVGVGYILISQVNDLLMFYLVFILALSFGNSFGTSMSSVAAVSNWFIRRRGVAVGILMGIFALGGGLGVPTLGWFIGQYGWRNAAIIAGCLFWVIGLPISRVIYRRPEERGLLPDGDQAPPAPAAGLGTAAHQAAYVEVEFTPRQALACSAFWLLAVASSVRHMVSSAIAVHEAPFLVDRGYSLEEASTLLGGTVLMSVLGRMFFGWLGDRWDRRWVLILCHVLMGVGVLLMPTITDANSPEKVATFILVFGIGYGGTIPVSIAIIADYFGRRNYATIQGLSGAVTMVGNVIGPVLAGYVFDVTRSYESAIISFGVLTLVVIPIFWIVRRPSPSDLRPACAPDTAERR